MRKCVQKRVGIFLIVALLSIIGLIGYQYYSSQRELQLMMNKTVFFYGKECPFCKQVESFMDKYHVQTRLHIVMKEVAHDRGNAKDYVSIASKCNVLQTQRQNGLVFYKIAIPMLWTGKECIEGDLPIINYFKKQLHIKAGSRKT